MARWHYYRPIRALIPQVTTKEFSYPLLSELILSFLLLSLIQYLSYWGAKSVVEIWCNESLCVPHLRMDQSHHKEWAKHSVVHHVVVNHKVVNKIAHLHSHHTRLIIIMVPCEVLVFHYLPQSSISGTFHDKVPSPYSHCPLVFRELWWLFLARRLSTSREKRTVVKVPQKVRGESSIPLVLLAFKGPKGAS